MKLKRTIGIAVLILCSVVLSVNAANTPLHDAVMAGDIGNIRKCFMMDKCWVMAQDSTGFSPLHRAIGRKNWDIIECLVKECGADVNQKDIRGMSPLHWAVRIRNEEIVRGLVEKLGANVNAQDSNGMTPFNLAFFMGELDIAKYLISHGGDVSIKCKDGFDSLLYAMCHGTPDLLRYLIFDCNVPTDVSTMHSANPLHVAAFHGNVFAASYLLSEGKTPINTDEVCAKALGEIPYGDDMCDDTLGSDAAFAKSCGEEVIAGKFRVFKDMLNEKNYRGMTPLHQAVRAGNSILVECFVRNGANVNAIDNYGFCPLHYAVIMGNFQTVRYLVENGANINARSSNGKTFLHYAVERNFYDIVIYLVEKCGADVLACDNYGHTPFDIAKSSRSSELCDYFEYRVCNREYKIQAEDVDPGDGAESEKIH